MHERTAQILVVGIFLLLFGIVVTTYAHCDQQYDRRAKCLESGHSALECERLYPVSGDGRR